MIFFIPLRNFAAPKLVNFMSVIIFVAKYACFYIMQIYEFMMSVTLTSYDNPFAYHQKIKLLNLK